MVALKGNKTVTIKPRGEEKYKNNWSPESNHDTDIILSCNRQKDNRISRSDHPIIRCATRYQQRMQAFTSRKELMPFKSSYGVLHYIFCGTNERLNLKS